MNIVLSVTIIFRGWFQKVTETWQVGGERTSDGIDSPFSNISLVVHKGKLRLSKVYYVYLRVHIQEPMGTPFRGGVEKQSAGVDQLPHIPEDCQPVPSCHFLASFS